MIIIYIYYVFWEKLHIATKLVLETFNKCFIQNQLTAKFLNSKGKIKP